MSQIDEWLTERKVDEVECLVPDMSGIARGKILPAHKFLKSVREQSCGCPKRLHPDRHRRVRRGRGGLVSATRTLTSP